MKSLTENKLEIRFYEELNDFLPKEKRKISFIYNFQRTQTIKDIIESLGVPHAEIDLIIANGISVNFNYRPNNDDKISVYPVFEALDITPLIRLRSKPLREPQFVLDVHLGKLARYMRLLGFDVLYTNHYSDEQLVKISSEDHRILLTRDINLLKHSLITHGYWMRHVALIPQLKEVIHRFDLKNQIMPFTRCLDCNGLIVPMEKTLATPQVPPIVGAVFSDYHRCSECQKIYWAGSHYEKMRDFVNQLLSIL